MPAGGADVVRPRTPAQQHRLPHRDAVSGLHPGHRECARHLPGLADQHVHWSLRGALFLLEAQAGSAVFAGRRGTGFHRPTAAAQRIALTPDRPPAAPKLVHLWIPDYQSGKGGIQVFTNYFIRALEQLLPDSAISIFSKNDTSLPPLSARISPTRFRSAGWWPAALRTSVFSAQIVRRALAERPDLVISTHVNFTPVARWLRRLAGLRYVTVAHGVDVWGVRSGSLPQALRGAERVLAVSHFTRDRLLEDMKLDPQRVAVLPNTFDPEQFQPSPKPRYLLKRHGLRPDQPVILTVTRLASAERYKGYDQILQSLPAIRAAVPNVRYVLAGRGPDRPRVEAMIRELGVGEAVTLAGYIPDHELCDYYNLCDVFAMPSKGEGFGIVFLEALACGKPVLAGNKDGSVDALLNGELGVLIDPDSRAAIEEALIAMLQRRHPLAILNDPARLRRQVIEAYAFPQFVKILGGHLRESGLAPTF
ncbi:MAG: glycosyltransferase family 4 protein [Verrucomicrobia bacterium]|nr:glycosyltransferase family 4 protein [Verrucomicrobiota bacterium]